MALNLSILDHSKWPALLKAARLDRPIGSLLLLWPTLAALWIAAGGIPSLHLLIVFSLGTLLTRSAGCVVNDLADQKLDKHVKRTALRPLATGEITSRDAIEFLVLLLIVSFGLVLTTNLMTIAWAIGAVAAAGIYPFLKRITHLPQVGLGIAFSFGIPMAFAATGAPITADTGLLFLANLIWVIAYDTCYAMVDRDDDLAIGIRSTAILFGDLDRTIIGLLQTLMIGLLIALGANLQFAWPYYLALGVISGLFIYQQWLIRAREREGCFAAFLNNQWAGMVLFIGVLSQY